MSRETESTDGGRSECLLPSFCTLRAAFMVVVTAELLAMILALAQGGGTPGFWDSLSRGSLLVQWIALVTAALLCVLRPWLARLDTWLVGLMAWGLLMLVALSVTELVVHGWPGLHARGASGASHWHLMLQVLGISAISGAMVLRYLYVQHQWRRQVEAESRARFQALQARIRPHFLFNSMNTIASLTRSDPVLAEEAVNDLADLFRASLSDNRGLSTLDQELELCRGYLRIEQQRLGERLRVEWSLEGLPGEAAVPALVLQPLVENAVYHGIERLDQPGVIRIIGRHRRGLVNLSVRNSSPPMDVEPRPGGHRLAVENIRQRLEGRFGDAASLSAGEVEGEYQVRIVFPGRGDLNEHPDRRRRSPGPEPAAAPGRGAGR